MIEVYIRIIAGLVAVSQLLMAPLATVIANPLTSGTGKQVADVSVLSKLTVAMSPTLLTTPAGQKHLWFSGIVSATSTPGSIYHTVFVQNTWQTPKPTFYIPGFRVSDPFVLADPSTPGQYLMFYTSISNANAGATTSRQEQNHIGLARSTDGALTWEDMGTVIAQDNRLDARGGWSPSAMMVGNEIWLYYSSNRPGPINIYRSRLDLTGKLLGTDFTYLTDDSQRYLEGFNADVSFQNGQYIMYLNTDFSSIRRYVSSDGIYWHTDSRDTNPIIQAPTDTIIAAPTIESISTANDVTQSNLYFAKGVVSNRTFSTIAEIVHVDTISSQVTLSQAATSSGSNVDSNSSSSNIGVLAVGVLGIAAAVGLTYLTSTAASAGATAVSGAADAASSVATGISYGGRVIAWLPCISILGPSFWVTLSPAGPLLPPFMYIWTPATLLNIAPPTPSIPPTHIGQEIMGRFDIPFWCCIPPSLPAAPGVCVIPGVHTPIPGLPGLRMQTAGVSPV